MKRLLTILMLLTFSFLSFSAFVPNAVAENEEVTPDITPSASEEDVSDWVFEDDEDDELDELTEDEEEAFFEDIDDEDAQLLEDENDDVESLMLEALEVYSWFYLYPLDVDYDIPDATGELYQVLDERYNTMDALRACLSEYFCDELVDELLSLGVYVEGEDGYLYTTDDGRPMDESILETEFELSTESETTRVYTADVFYWDTEGSDETVEEMYKYQQELIDGSWKFTIFPFFW